MQGDFLCCMRVTRTPNVWTGLGGSCFGRIHAYSHAARRSWVGQTVSTFLCNRTSHTRAFFIVGLNRREGKREGGAMQCKQGPGRWLALGAHRPECAEQGASATRPHWSCRGAAVTAAGRPTMEGACSARRERGWDARKREGRGDDRGYGVRTMRVARRTRAGACRHGIGGAEPRRGWGERERSTSVGRRGCRRMAPWR